MSSAKLQRGQLVMARFRPDNVGTVKKVYGSKCDIDRIMRPSLHGVPTKALTPVGDDVTLYSIATPSFGHLWTRAIVAGADGIESWCKHHAAEVEGAQVCVVNHRMQQVSGYVPVAGLLTTDQTEQPQAA